jgi:hypothetical protein
MLYTTNLKIPNGLSEAVNPRTDNANRTKEKRTKHDLQNTTQKIKI